MCETIDNVENYYTNKYVLTATHSEIVEAVKIIALCEALDLGCGMGRNALFLNLKGFKVTAWDNNPQSVTKLNEIIQLEALQNITATIKDLNITRFKGHYDFIFSTVVFMFLDRAHIPNILHDMQESTKIGGYNLIVSAMDSEDYPCAVPFSFTFSPGELHNYYHHWTIIKYNEDVGELHRTDESGNRIKMRFATLLAQKKS